MRESGSKKECEHALRIMEALSGVDEVLLERSAIGEKARERQDVLRRRDSARRGREHRQIWQMGRTWAAVCGLAVLGVMAWGRWQMLNSDVLLSGSGGSPSLQPGYNNGNNNVTYSTGTSAGGEGIDTDGLIPKSDGAAPGSGPESESTDHYADQTDSSSIEDTETNKEVCGVNTADKAEKITEKEARAMEGVGGYIPAKLPEGYQFGAAYWNADSQCLSVSWERGMDSIILWLEIEEEDREVVDVHKPETYDVRLYEIPYADSVPDEYREIFANPVFAWEDFSKEIVESRMKSYLDKGDTDTPRGNFGIFFPDGVFVRFNGRGTPEQIWEMFSTMGL